MNENNATQPTALNDGTNPEAESIGSSESTLNEWPAARRHGVSPSSHLRRHFVALARRVKHWSAPCGRPAKIGVTALDRRVGKSTIAFNLASALTRIEGDHVLLVESDFGKHFVSRKLGFAGRPGLSEIIVGGNDPQECIVPTSIDDLSVLGSGHISEQESLEMPFDLLGPILEKNFDQFGYLIFDLPVASDLTSCYSILPNLDGVMIAVEAGNIDRKVIGRAKNRLANMGIELIGLVINQI